jgi:hypothetical protein
MIRARCLRGRSLWGVRELEGRGGVVITIILMRVSGILELFVQLLCVVSFLAQYGAFVTACTYVFSHPSASVFQFKI